MNMLSLHIWDVSDITQPAILMGQQTVQQIPGSTSYPSIDIQTTKVRMVIHIREIPAKVDQWVCHNDPVNGYVTTISDNGINTHTMMIREGCTGSPDCAMEWYIGEGTNYLNEGPNIHFSDRELEDLYRAVKAVRKHRKEQLRERV